MREEEEDAAEVEETAAEKRLRLAKEYLARLEDSGQFFCSCRFGHDGGCFIMVFERLTRAETKDGEAADHDTIGQRLKEDLVGPTYCTRAPYMLIRQCVRVRACV